MKLKYHYENLLYITIFFFLIIYITLLILTKQFNIKKQSKLNKFVLTIVVTFFVSFVLFHIAEFIKIYS